MAGHRSPVRGFASYKRQRHLTGSWWTATTGTLVGYESRLERDRLVLLDFDPQVVGISSQPFWLFWSTGEGRPRSHASDYFARRGDGSVLVLDCRPSDRIRPRDQAAFDATGAACDALGWEGKTTALTLLGRTHERAARRKAPTAAAGAHRLPVIYVTSPPAATPKMLAAEFARFLGLEFRPRANLPEIVNAVCATAVRAGVELVLVDEIHNLNLATRSGAEVSDQLKYFAERLPATFAYAGIELESGGLFAGVRGRQIAGRFTLIGSAAFDHGTAAQRENWHALIATLESTLRLRHHVPGTLVALADYLYHRTGGMIGSLSQLVRGGALLAIEDGGEHLTRDLLDLVPVDHAADRATARRAPQQAKPAARKARA